MRKVICSLAMASMCMCLSGCGQHPYQNYVPTASASRQPESSSSSITQVNSSSIETNHEQIKSLKGKITSLKTLVMDFKKNGELKGQTEFETFNEFLSRKEAFLQNPFFEKRYFVYADDTTRLPSELKYNPYSNKFEYTAQNYPVKYIYTGKGQFAELPLSLIVQSVHRAKGSYMGANAFGVSVAVEKSQTTMYVLNVTNKDRIKHNPSVVMLSNYVSGISGTSNSIDAKQAEKIKNQLELVYEFIPSMHYVYPEKWGVITKVSEYDSPTLDSPYETERNITVLFVEIVGVHLVNKKTQEVLGSVNL